MPRMGLALLRRMAASILAWCSGVAVIGGGPATTNSKIQKSQSLTTIVEYYVFY